MKGTWKSGKLFGEWAVARYYGIRVPNLEQTIHDEWRGCCPIHQGDRDSFAVNRRTGWWYCHSECGKGGSIFDLEMALTGKRFAEAKAAVFQLVEEV